MNDALQPEPEPMRAHAPPRVDTCHVIPWKDAAKVRPDLETLRTGDASRASDEVHRATLRATREAIRPHGIELTRSDDNHALPARRAGRKSKASPSIFRDAARVLIKPKSGLKPGDKIAFEPDDTPAHAEQVLGLDANPGRA